jgi:Domain of unknown function (DUF4136)
MPVTRKLLAAAMPLALLMVTSCAEPFQANVARFQSLPAPQGQSFSIQPVDVRNEGGLEFAQYAGLVSQRLAAYGYRPAAGAKAELSVQLDYGIDKGVQKTVSRPSPSFGGYGGFGRYGYGHRWGYGSAFYYGWDPFGYDPFFDQSIDTYTIYTSYMTMTIVRPDGQHVFEGKAKARSLDDNMTVIVPKLIEAMFTNFPGQSGEEVKITVAPPAKK